MACCNPYCRPCNNQEMRKEEERKEEGRGEGRRRGREGRRGGGGEEGGDLLSHGSGRMVEGGEQVCTCMKPCTCW